MYERLSSAGNKAQRVTITLSVVPTSADGEAATGGQVEWAPPPVNFVHNEQIQWSAVKPPILEAIESGVQRGLNAGVCVCVRVCVSVTVYIYQSL